MYKILKILYFLLLTICPVNALAAETESNLWIDLIAAWGPFIIFITIWIFYMRMAGVYKNSKYIDRSLEHMEKVEELLQKIANQNNVDRKDIQ